MMNKIKNNWMLLLSLLFLVATWCYWWLEYPAILVFREQIQMFLFNTDYFSERIIYPAGLARYVGEFIGQFYNIVVLGALIIAVLSLLLHLLTYKACSAIAGKSNKTALFYLSYLPVLLLLVFMGNENVNTTFPVAILLTLCGMWGYGFVKARWSRWLYVLTVAPVLYWFSGPVVLIMGVYILFAELLRKNYALASFSPIYMLLWLFGSSYIVAAPLNRLLLGISYSILITELMPLQVIVPVCFAAVPVVASYLPELKEKNAKLVHIVSLSVLILTMLFVLPMGVEKNRYEVFEYDYLVRSCRWEAIIRKAERKNPTSPLTVSSLNLALAMTGQQNERAGQFYQNGSEGAFPLFNKNFLFSLMTSEVYYGVGFVNTAQRFAFEAMETIPDNNKSARIVKRLVETNLINGQYEVARKYLDLLKQTVFYAKWAERTQKLLGDEKAINDHLLYGHMRKIRLQKDFIFSEQEIDKMIGQLIMQNPENSAAQQYLLLMPMLEGNREKYMAYRDFLQRAMQRQMETDSVNTDTSGREDDDDPQTTAPVDGKTGATQQTDGRTSATQSSR